MADCFQYVVFAEVIYLYGIEFFPCQNLLVRYQSAIRSDFGHIGILCPGTDRPFQKPDIAVKILGIRTSFQGDDFFRRRSGNGCRKNGVEDARRIKLDYLQVVCGKDSIPMATVRLIIDGERCMATAAGNGPIDASINAVRQLITQKVTLEEFLIQAFTRGTDDVGKVHIQVENKGKVYYGFSADTDIITASVNAYIDAVSKII